MGGIWQQPPTSRKVKVITFDGGHNVGTPPVSVEDNQSIEEVGWELDDNFPALHTRRGRVTFGTSGAATPRLFTELGKQKLIRAAGTKIQYHNGTDWVDLAMGLTDTDWTATNFEVAGKPAVIFTNGSDDVKYWDGTTFGNLSTNAPKGKFITNDTIRVWIAKGDELHYTAFLDAQDWTSVRNSGVVQFYTPKGGDITALAQYADRTIAFKADAMSEIHGTNYFEFRLMRISLDIGCVNHKTIQEVQGHLLWLGPGLDVYVYTGGRPDPIGFAIKGYLNQVNPEHLDKCFAGTDGVRYYLGLVTGSNTEPNLLLSFHPKLGAWRVVSKNDSYRQSYLFNGIWFLSDDVGKTYKVMGTTDDGQSITSEYVTKPFDGEFPQAEKEFFEAHLQGYIPVGSTVKLYISPQERDGTFRLIDTIVGGADSQAADLFIPMDSVPLCKWSRFKIVATGEVTLYQMQLSFDVHPIQS